METKKEGAHLTLPPDKCRKNGLFCDYAGHFKNLV